MKIHNRITNFKKLDPKYTLQILPHPSHILLSCHSRKFFTTTKPNTTTYSEKGPHNLHDVTGRGGAQHLSLYLVEMTALGARDQGPVPVGAREHGPGADGRPRALRGHGVAPELAQVAGDQLAILAGDHEGQAELRVQAQLVDLFHAPYGRQTARTTDAVGEEALLGAEQQEAVLLDFHDCVQVQLERLQARSRF